MDKLTAKEMILEMKSNGFSYEDIASNLHVSFATVYRWSKGAKQHRAFFLQLEQLFEEKRKK